MANKKRPSRQTQILHIVGIIILAVALPAGLLFGAVTIFSYANFNTERARIEARYEAEVQLNSIEGVRGSVVIENLGGTPPTKKSLLVNLYVDTVPEGVILTNMVKYGFERTWKGYNAFRPDDITVQILKKDKPKDARDDTSLLDGVRVLHLVKKDLPWVSGSSSSGGMAVSSAKLQAEFGPSGRDI